MNNLENLLQIKLQHDELAAQIKVLESLVKIPDTEGFIFCEHLHWDVPRYSVWAEGSQSEQSMSIKVSNSGQVALVNLGKYTAEEAKQAMVVIKSWLEKPIKGAELDEI